MKIAREEVERIAKLAYLDLRGDEAEDMAGQLDVILKYVVKLDKLDTSGVAVTTHPQDLVNSFREDEDCDCLQRDKALSGSAKHNGETFVVPKVVG
jgi:aspartyl-tRNA(Asn)/glutamyl-tRNA(Gln) amidotransferase subunit C